MIAQFFIQLDKDFYFSGDMVNGHVFISVPQPIPMSTGISLKFTGYQVVKFLTKQVVQQFRKYKKGKKWVRKRVIPLSKIHNQSHPPQVSEVESQGNRDRDFRPRYIRYSGSVYQMSYYQTRNGFTKNKMLMYQCNGLPPGQYSFPFSFKTFEGWPASFEHRQRQKKGLIVYNISAIIQPQSPQFQMKFSREIVLRETRMVNTQIKQGKNQIKYCGCCNYGQSSINFHLQKDGYMPGEMVNLIVQVDNTQCSSDIKSISISIDNRVTMRSQGTSTNSNFKVFSKLMSAVPAKQARIGQNALTDSFQLQSNKQIKPTCSGKLLSSEFFVTIKPNHQYGCQCCTHGVSATIPIIIFPYITPIVMPNVFQNNWNPQIMPSIDMAVTNSFQNFNLASMAPQQQPQFDDNFAQQDSQDDSDDEGQGMQNMSNQGMKKENNENMIRQPMLGNQGQPYPPNFSNQPMNMNKMNQVNQINQMNQMNNMNMNNMNNNNMNHNMSQINQMNMNQMNNINHNMNQMNQINVPPNFNQ